MRLLEETGRLGWSVPFSVEDALFMLAGLRCCLAVPRGTPGAHVCVHMRIYACIDPALFLGEEWAAMKRTCTWSLAGIASVSWVCEGYEPAGAASAVGCVGGLVSVLKLSPRPSTSPSSKPFHELLTQPPPGPPVKLATTHGKQSHSSLASHLQVRS